MDLCHFCSTNDLNKLDHPLCWLLPFCQFTNLPVLLLLFMHNYMSKLHTSCFSCFYRVLSVFLELYLCSLMSVTRIDSRWFSLLPLCEVGVVEEMHSCPITEQLWFICYWGQRNLRSQLPVFVWTLSHDTQFLWKRWWHSVAVTSRESEGDGSDMWSILSVELRCIIVFDIKAKPKLYKIRPPTFIPCRHWVVLVLKWLVK